MTAASKGTPCGSCMAGKLSVRNALSGDGPPSSSGEESSRGTGRTLRGKGPDAYVRITAIMSGNDHPPAGTDHNRVPPRFVQNYPLRGSPLVSPARRSDSVQAVIQGPGMDQESKKRLFGSFSVHILTKKVRPFPRRYSSKMTNVFLGTPRLPQPFWLSHLRNVQAG